MADLTTLMVNQIYEHRNPIASRMWGESDEALVNTLLSMRQEANAQAYAGIGKGNRELLDEWVALDRRFDCFDRKQLLDQAQYYLEAIRGPGPTQLAVQDLPSPTRVALAAPKPKHVSRVKKPSPQQKIAKSRPQPSKRIPRSHNEFASLIERAFRGY